MFLNKEQINYQKNTETNPITYSINPYLFDGYNCNSFSNGLLQYSGSNQTEPNDFIGIDWGKNNPVPEMNFQSENEKINIINNLMETK